MRDVLLAHQGVCPSCHGSGVLDTICDCTQWVYCRIPDALMGPLYADPDDDDSDDEAKADISKLEENESWEDAVATVEEDTTVNIADVTACYSAGLSEDRWLLDSGAMVHITRDKGVLQSPKPCTVTVKVGSGEELASESQGDVLIKLDPTLSLTLKV